jgi:drug/metabolite transporter (DMT)-like permease
MTSLAPAGRAGRAERAYEDGGMADSRAAGFLMAAAGVVTFSVTYPATQEAMRSFSPWTIAMGRAVAAAAVASGCLLARQACFPGRAYLVPLMLVGAGVVIGFPLLISLALGYVSSPHAAVVTGLLPLATALSGRFRGRERPSRLFWWAACAGAAIIGVYTLRHGETTAGPGDLLLAASLLAGGIGFAEGGLVARHLPGWQVISWGLVLSLPVTVPVTVISVILSPPRAVTLPAAAGLAYVSLFSMFLGFLAWYPGLARAGVTRGSQVQLLQPLLTVGWAALLLHQPVTAATLVAATGVLVCVALAQRARLAQPPAVPAAAAPPAAAPPAANGASSAPGEAPGAGSGAATAVGEDETC